MIVGPIFDKNGRECNACRSTIDVKSIKIGLSSSSMVNICLCGTCRSLLHKRLHEEDKNVNA